MSQFVLYDDAIARTFEPFALSRPLGEVRAGALLIRARWERALGLPCAGFLGAAHLADFEEIGAAGAFAAAEGPAGTVVVNARALPSLVEIGPVGVLALNGQVAAVRLTVGWPSARFSDGTVSLEDVAADGPSHALSGGHWLAAPWDLIRHLSDMLADDVVALGSMRPCVDPAPATVLGAHAVFIEAGAHVEPMVIIDASTGPVFVSSGATISAFSRLVGPCFVAPGAQVLGGKVGHCAIGEQCRVHGEVSHTIFIGHANKGHDGFVGHSILGRWVNLGAATATSNLKNTYGTVQLWTPTGAQSTGLQFLGTMFGDHAKTSIGTRLTTGSVVGTGANVVGSGISPKVVSPFIWGEGDALYDVERFLTVAARMMSRRGVSLGEGGRRHLLRVFAARWTAGA